MGKAAVPPVPPIPDRWDDLLPVDGDESVLEGAITIHLGQAPPQWMSGQQGMARAQKERDRLQAWAESDDEQRRILLAVVYSTLRRLMGRPSWVPRAARLDGGRVDLHIVVELYEDQVAAGAAATQLARDAARAREGLAALAERFRNREDGADGTPAQDQ